MPKISVIIPTFNRAHTIENAIRSVWKQDFSSTELIVVNDGSTDETTKLLEKLALEGPMKIYHTPQKGVSAARNQGMKMAKGEWMAFLDSDDEWLPHKLSEQWKLTPHYKVIHTEEQWIRNGVRVNQMNKHKKSGGWIFEKCLPMCLMSPSTVLIHNSVFNEVGHFKEDYPVCEDYDLWLRITPWYAVGFVEKPCIVKYGGHEDQLSRKFKGMDYYRIKSLVAAKQSFLPGESNQLIGNILNNKVDIYEKGLRKHRKLEELEALREVLVSY